MGVIGEPGPDRSVGSEITKSVKISGLEVDAAKMKDAPTSPRDVAATKPPHEGIRSLAPGQTNLPKAAELLGKQLKGENPRERRALAMAVALDRYVEKAYARQVEHAVKHALKDLQKVNLSPDQKTQIAEKAEAKIFKKFSDSIQFFVSVDSRKGPVAPLERMCAPFDYLSPPEDKVKNEQFEKGISDYSAELARLAFDQHLDNPEQYVSHGFDHSINVANYTRDVLNMNPEIYRAAASKYKISEGEAKFMLETVALLHDCGYPCVGCKAKSVHGVSGADIVLPMREMFQKFINSPEAKQEELFSDFRNSIMFHSADKIEYAFSSKIVSTLGTFLADQQNIVQVLSNFYNPDKNPSGQARFVTEIYVQNPEVKKEIEVTLQAAREDFEGKAGRAIELPKVTIHDGLFKGRFADLEFNKDKLLGLEFSTADLLSQPLNMIRLVDNMDMRKTRFTPTQNEAAFRRVYYELGNNNEISQIAMSLEKLEREVDTMVKKAKSPQERLGLQADISRATKELVLAQIERMQTVKDPLTQSVFAKLKSEADAMENPAETRKILNRVLIDTIFEQPEFRDMPADVKQEVRLIGMSQSSIDLRHFGGCEAVMDVQLRGIPLENGKMLPVIQVTVDEELFRDLNAIKVTESSPTLTGVQQSITVGVGEYQIWRASDAYRSLLLGGNSISLQIVNSEGKPVATTFQQA